jgi:hypothetical protein
MYIIRWKFEIISENNIYWIFCLNLILSKNNIKIGLLIINSLKNFYKILK